MAGRKIPMLSKSRFIAGLQCPLRLWYQCFNRDLATPVSPSQQAIFDTGNEVGRLATQLYPGGVLIEEDHLHHREAVESTRAAMADPGVPAIYEAGFVHDSVRIRVDVLERTQGGKWNLIEVKSSTSAKDVHLPDVAVQYRVLKGMGLDVARAGILHLNDEYVYDGQRLDPEQLFIFSDLSREAIDYQGEVQANLRRLREILAGPNPPGIEPGRHCSSPYRCEFWEHCTAGKSKSWIWFGWTSNCSASSTSVRSPFMAATATFAFNFGEWFLGRDHRLQHGGDRLEWLPLAQSAPNRVGVDAAVAEGLFSSFRDMAGHGGRPFQGVVGSLLFAILGAVDDRGLFGTVAHSFVAEARPNQIRGQVFQGFLLPRLDALAGKDVEAGVSCAFGKPV